MTAEAAHSLDFGGELLSFVIERTARRKTVAISVGYDGVRVLAPSDLDDGRVISIVRKKGAWLLRKQAGYKELGGSPIVREFVSGETFHYLGRPYRLKVVADNAAVVTRITAHGSTLVAPVPVQAALPIRRAAVRSGLRLWYREHAKAHFPVRARTNRRRFTSQAQARMAVFTFIESFYNPVRLHSALGYRSPIRYEQEMLTDA